MAERLFGMETEYGFAVRGPGGAYLTRGRDWSERLFQLAARSLKNLPSADGGGIFLPNGARFYLDCGHPEMTTPECANPWDVVRYMQAGERLLLSVAEELKQRERSITEALVFKTNVDHSGSGATWGCHTSFLHQANPAALPAQLIPFLASKLIFTGAGGIETGPNGLRFTLSPRVAFLEQEVSGSSTHGRGIFHTKDESLCADGFHRLHILCNESLCSDTALWLSMGATALVVAMIEIGIRPGEGVKLANPLAAMRQFASDPACTTIVMSANKRSLTAIEIQRHYLELAETHLRHPLMPPWADRVCKEWRSMLDRLARSAPASVATTLDWAIKFCLFSERLARRGLTWAKSDQNLSLLFLEVDEGRDVPRVRLPPEFKDVHQELCELDTRFGQLGDQGIFSALDRASALSHRFPGVDNIEHALANPPAIGRARLRGECVQRYADENTRYSASWTSILDREKKMLLDLSQPFVQSAQWKELPPGSARLTNVRDRLRQLLS